MKFYKKIILLLAAVSLVTVSGTAQTASRKSVPAFDDALLEIFSTIPIQEGGRIKPLDTAARFTMLRLNGVRSFKTDDGTKLSPMEWYLHCLFYPEVSDTYKHFIVDDSEAISAIGVTAHEDKRDRYSYEEIIPHRMKLFQLAQEYSRIEANEQNRIEKQVLNLANNVFEYEQISNYLDFAMVSFKIPPESAISETMNGKTEVSLTEAIFAVQETMRRLREISATLDEEQLNNEVNAIADLSGQLRQGVARSFSLHIFPPSNVEVKEWRSPADIIGDAHEFVLYSPEELAPLATLEKLTALRDERIAFKQEAQKFQEEIELLASARGEYKKIPLEVSYYKGNYFFYAQWLFMLAFIVFAISLLVPSSKKLYLASWGLVTVPLILLIVGITIRCIIRERPPISTLYETILFIAACCVVVALFLEYVNRQRVALATASVLGFLGMVLAYRYEAKEAVDTMPSLQAVLDTNFWLMIHVTTINIGYAASFLSGALAHVYIIGRFFNVKNNPKTYRGLTRMVYGVLCFGLLFSVVGTVLGGIWANDSWGRFWGWDPKENGALMICIWALVVLHARMGFYIRDLGVNMGAVVLAMITAFSWWGVNLLGVGLHSYGFTSGIMNLLFIYWGAECVVIALGVWVSLRDKMNTHASAEA